MEFEIKTDLSAVLPSVIEFNFEEQKAWLEERLQHYNNLVVTEDTIKEGKADRAKLNKLKEAIDTRRKEIKKEWLAPYTAFETKVKELIELINQPIKAIDGQLDTYEQARQEEKRQEIFEAYGAAVPETLQGIIPLERIFKSQWLNATTKLKKVEEELAEIVKRTNADMMLLDTVEEEYKAAVRDEYIQTLDIARAMNKKTSLQAASAAFQQHEEDKANIQPTPQPISPSEAKKEGISGELKKLTLELYLTQEQAGKLKAFLVENNIEHRKI